uniref:IF rod domain-containing protein n=1 Tax=Oncorhynchus tshawytscha TaxID=74940 RepID=A0A8C8GCZ4_ONCTS
MRQVRSFVLEVRNYRVLCSGVGQGLARLSGYKEAHTMRDGEQRSIAQKGCRLPAASLRTSAAALHPTRSGCPAIPPPYEIIERQEMVVLNDRLAVYIDKVNSLEQQNKQLEMEIEGLQNRFVKPSGLRLLYEQIRCESSGAWPSPMRRPWSALEKRKVAELEIEAFLRRGHLCTHQLMAQVYSGHSSSQSSFALPDLLAALKQIQSQYNEIAAKILAEMDSWYKSKFEDITNKTTKHVDKARSVREEITSARKDIQNKECDLDALNDALEAEVNKTTERYKRELEDLQARIEALKLELETTKEKIAHHLREYQDLLDIKMALEIEITTYRKLIEGEDLQLSSMVKNLFWDEWQNECD